MKPGYNAYCFERPNQIAGIAGADFSTVCKFRNTGSIAWPKDVHLKLVNMNHVYYRTLGMENQCIQPYEELSITIEVKLPKTLGKYLLNFRLVHGNNIEFGDAVSVYLLS